MNNILSEKTNSFLDKYLYLNECFLKMCIQPIDISKSGVVCVLVVANGIICGILNTLNIPVTDGIPVPTKLKKNRSAFFGMRK